MYQNFFTTAMCPQKKVIEKRFTMIKTAEHTKKLVSAISTLVAMLVLATTIFASGVLANAIDNASNPFIDVGESDWFCDDVEYVVAKGIFKGITSNTFEPNTSITRAMFVTTLSRLHNGDDSGSIFTSTHYRFDDVPPEVNEHYTNHVYWAQRVGVTNGVDETHFNPDGLITQQDLAVMLYQYELYRGIYLIDIGAGKEIADWESVDDYAKEAVYSLYSKGIINGKSDNLFDPQGTATRAEVAAILHRFSISIGE